MMAEYRIRLQARLSGRTLKEWRKSHGYSATQAGRVLNCTRSYIKSIEGGSLAASQKFIQRFNEQRAGDGEIPPLAEAPEPLKVHCRYKLPASFKILAKPRHCKCGLWFIPRTPNQKQCGQHARSRTNKRSKGRA